MNLYLWAVMIILCMMLLSFVAVGYEAFGSGDTFDLAMCVLFGGALVAAIQRIWATMP